jgi:hypothetical protein
MKRKIIIISLLVLFGFHGICYSELTLVSAKCKKAPVLDGNGQDPAWSQVQELTTHDNVANLDISLKSVYTNDKVFFLVRFYDPDESRSHKPWVWNQKEEIYEIGTEREDCLIFKWAMGKEISDLSLHADKAYTADVWFWKANRTDPVGYADDKIQRLKPTKSSKSMKLRSKSGKPRFLQRRGDKGKAAYKSTLYVDFLGDKIPQFKHRNPSESRADVKAKGVWSKNEWCIEFSRSLTTNQDDDVQFDLSEKYFFGISRYEVAGKKPNPKLSQPLYGSGDVSDKLFLVFSN